MDILLASVILVIIIKTTIVTTVVKGFGYNNKTALLVIDSVSNYDLSCLLPCLTIPSQIDAGWNISGSDRGVCLCTT